MMKRVGRDRSSGAGRRGGVAAASGAVGLVALVSLVTLVGCGEGPPGDTAELEPLMTFDTTRLSLISDADTVRITAEVATDPDRRAMGLMEREDLPPEHGMIFVYPTVQDTAGAFYMYRTLIPLDIAFLDEEGRIVRIRAMEPCRSPNPRLCPRYAAGAQFKAALEVNRGFFERHGIGVGDRVEPLPEALE